MSKKKLSKQSIPQDPSGSIYPTFDEQFQQDLGWWYKTDKSKVKRIFDLISDTILHPSFEGLGKPEPLKHLSADIWSRRIDLEHRLIYRVGHERIDFLQARYHY